jgi:large subunit ribosomal protein L18
MKTAQRNNVRKQLRIKRARAKVHGTAARPRLSAFRSLKHLELQLIDDEKGVTLISVHDTSIKTKKSDAKTGANVAKAYELGKLLAEKAKAKGITAVVFDRRGTKFHGRIEAVAKGAQDGGIKV